MAEVVIAVVVAACCVYLTSAAAKLRSRQAYREFVAGLGETELIPGRRLPATAMALLAGETLASIALATAGVLTVLASAGAGSTGAGSTGASVVTVAALGLAAALTGILAAGIAVILRRGIRARCACFGAASDRPLGLPHLTRNLTLLALLAIAIVCSLGSQEKATAGGVVVAAFAGLVGGLLLTRLDELIDLFAPLADGPAR